MQWAPNHDTAFPSPSAVDSTSQGHHEPGSPDPSMDGLPQHCGWLHGTAGYVHWAELGLAGTMAIGRKAVVGLGERCKGEDKE